MNNSEKLAILDTQDTRRRKQTQHNMLWTSVCTNTNTNNVNETSALLQTTGGKDEPNIVLCGNRNGHHNTELRTYRHIIKT